jgi:NAD(P)-dependent dehydrogenase (short-subunit alcohol dehydrogenase family)
MTYKSIPLKNKNILITGSARRLGKQYALALAREGANVILHHGHSPEEAEQTRAEIASLGGNVTILEADLEDPIQVKKILPRAMVFGELFGLINNAGIFSPGTSSETDLITWQKNIAINLTAPFLLSQAFANLLPPNMNGRIINILDWRALKPGADHFAYTISKAGLAAMTKSMAQDYAPRINVNGLALGAVLPPSDGSTDPNLLNKIPIGRWASINEIIQALIFLLTGPEYITGEIIHVDGGQHLL